MMRIAFVALLGIAIVTRSVEAQTRPDFSGTWSLPADAPLLANGKPAPAPGFGSQINIVQTKDTITVSRVMGGQTVHIAHPLDGSETRSNVSGRLCEADVSYVWRAEWKDNAVALNQLGAWPAGATAMTPMELGTVLRQPAPDTLLVELTFRNAGMTEPQTRSTKYVRTGAAAAVPPPTAGAPTKARIDQLAWLGGNWLGTTDAARFEERWTPPAGGVMLATARTLRSGVMRDFEFLCIVERNGGLVYQAMPSGRQPATDFVLTRIDSNSFTFENEQNSFPKMIRYTLAPDGTLEAVISGTDKQKPQTFRFRKQGN